MSQFISDSTELTAERAVEWLRRWDVQQERYVPDRDERFAVMADVVETVAAGAESPLIVDIGAGPGSLSLSLLDRMPQAEVVAVDADPLLLGLGRAAHSERAGLRFVETDLRGEGWTSAAKLEPGTVDAVVSTTALHWLTGPELAELYRVVGPLLRPGGVFVDGDHLFESDDSPRLGELTRIVRERRVQRVGTEANEDWEAWWVAVDDAPELRALAGERGARPIDHSVPDVPSLRDHIDFLRDAGFAEAGTVWQHGDDRVLVGVLGG